ncbi:MAG: YkgJ family cysteine cluster protein [Hyphomicrobium sp.]
MSAPQYNCSKCPGYCCSYPLIALDKRDVERLAKHHGLSFEDARRTFTKEENGRKYAMRRKKDSVFGRICRFFDTDKPCSRHQ